MVLFDALQLPVYVCTAACMGCMLECLIVVRAPAVVCDHAPKVRQHSPCNDALHATLGMDGDQRHLLGGGGVGPLHLAGDPYPRFITMEDIGCKHPLSQVGRKLFAAVGTIREDVAHRAVAEGDARKTLHQLADPRGADHAEGRERYDHRLEVGPVLQVGVHPLRKAPFQGFPRSGAENLDALVPALLRCDAHVDHVPGLDDGPLGLAFLGMPAGDAVGGKALEDGIGLILEPHGRTFMALLAAALPLGAPAALVDRGRLGLVEEISGGRLAAVGAVLVLLLLELGDPGIFFSDELLEFIDGAGKLFDGLRLGDVLVVEPGELGRLLDSLQNQFLIGRGNTVNLAIESVEFLFPRAFRFHLNTIST